MVSSEELQEQYEVAAVLNPVWKALQYANTADFLEQMQHSDVGLEPDKLQKRITVLEMCKKFAEAERDKNLIASYDALKLYLEKRGLLKGEQSATQGG